MCSNNTNQQREITNECKGPRACGMANIVISNLNILTLELDQVHIASAGWAYSERYVK
jgi:hypothetical protein